MAERWVTAGMYSGTKVMQLSYYFQQNIRIFIYVKACKNALKSSMAILEIIKEVLNPAFKAHE